MRSEAWLVRSIQYMKQLKDVKIGMRLVVIRPTEDGFKINDILTVTGFDGYGRVIFDKHKHGYCSSRIVGFDGEFKVPDKYFRLLPKTTIIIE